MCDPHAATHVPLALGLRNDVKRSGNGFRPWATGLGLPSIRWFVRPFRNLRSSP